jgi:putative transposase
MSQRVMRAHKIRLNPTIEQEVHFKKALGTSRFVFNWGLNRWKEQKENGVAEYGPAALKAEFNAVKREQFPWTLEVTKNAVEDGFRRLSAALKNYFDSKNGKRKGEQVGFPKFKSKRMAKPSFTLDYERFRVDGHSLSIQRLGTPVNMAECLRFDGKAKWATISCVAGKWYVSIQVELEQPPKADPPQAAVGVDMGLKTLATLSSGDEFENQKLLRSELTHLKRLSRRLSRRKEGSNRWWGAKRRLAALHERVANRRADITHKMTTEIARTYQLVAIEDLNIKGMARNRKLALSVADAGMGEILRQLKYKSTRVVEVSRWYASSKTCLDCGHIHQELTISDRHWVCARCGVQHARDWNAALNILQEGVRLAAVACPEG